MPGWVKPVTIVQLAADAVDRRREIDEGRVIEFKQGSLRHSLVGSEVFGVLRSWARGTGAGTVFVCGALFALRRNPDTLRGPDVSFVRAKRMSGVDLNWIYEGPPDVAVEVLSPNDRPRAVLRKTTQYLEAGAAEVWNVIPEKREVHVHTQTEQVRIVREGETLTSAALPGFTVVIDEFFKLQ